MAETGRIESLVPLHHWPANRSEMATAVKAAFSSARTMIAAHGGRVIGLTGIARAETLDGQVALRATFQAEAPEAAWPAKRLF